MQHQGLDEMFLLIVINCRLIMRAPQKKFSSISKLVELLIESQSWLTSLGSLRALLMWNFWNKKPFKRLSIWMNLNYMVARLRYSRKTSMLSHEWKKFLNITLDVLLFAAYRLHLRGLMFLGWSSVHHVDIIHTMALLTDHTARHIFRHMVTGKFCEIFFLASSPA